MEEQSRVFISYRKRPELEGFAEALAGRLEREGLRTFFDKWDVLAGDSLPGKIEEAFATSHACIVILSSDYHDGRWATQEMRTAITKRVEGGFRLIPVVYEDGPIPELLKDAVRVDFRDHNPDHFELRARDIIQGLFGLSGRQLRQVADQN